MQNRLRKKSIDSVNTPVLMNTRLNQEVAGRLDHGAREGNVQVQDLLKEAKIDQHKQPKGLPRSSTKAEAKPTPSMQQTKYVQRKPTLVKKQTVQTKASNLGATQPIRKFDA